MKYLKIILLSLILASGAFAQGVFYSDGSSWQVSTSYSPVIWNMAGQPGAVATGTDVTADDGDRHITEIMIPYRTVVTGIFYLIGSQGGTDSVIVDLYDYTGTLVAGGSSITVAGDAEVLVATGGDFQKVPFSGGTITINPGRYFVSATFNGTTAKYRAPLVPGAPYTAITTAGTFGTAASVDTVNAGGAGGGAGYTNSEGIIGGVY